MMRAEDMVHVMAGLFIMVSLTLAWLHNSYWLFLTGFVGLNLFQYGFTRFCPMTMVLKKLGLRSYCDISPSN